MLVFLSPAKTLDFESDQQIGETSSPYFNDEAAKVNHKLKSLSRNKLMKLQSISRQLAGLNYQRNQEWSAGGEEESRQAVLAFKGDVYIGLQAEKWGEQEMEFANKHLRILSGLYGILRPSDLVLPYRLEMGTSLPVGRRKNLYHFWGDKIKSYFKEQVDTDEVVVNLASKEYFKAIETAKVKNRVIDTDFRDFTNGEFKVVSFFAKKARGLMADFIVQNRLESPEGLKHFDSEGYYFDGKTSTETKFVFLRDQKQ